MASGDGSKKSALGPCHEPVAGATLMGKVILVFEVPPARECQAEFFLGKFGVVGGREVAGTTIWCIEADPSRGCHGG